jgi:aerobic C4-dicarboxylate transport protein
MKSWHLRRHAAATGKGVVLAKLVRGMRAIYVQVLIAIGLAIVFGLVAPDWARAMKPLGDAFVGMLRLMIGPIIFCTIVLGLAQIGDLRQLGRVFIKAFVYFEVISTLALCIGLVIGNLLGPGTGLHAGTGEKGAMIAKYQESAAKQGGFADFLFGVIPDTFFSAFVKGDILQILLLSVLFGAAAIILRHEVQGTLRIVEELQKIFFRIIGFMMRLAPIGAFGAMAYTVATHGGETLVSLTKLVLLVYASCILFVLIVLGGVLAACGLSILKVLRLIREELLIVFGTASAESVLPRLTEKLERAGCERAIVGLVLPTGYSFNTDGTALYMSMAVIFISQATDTALSLSQQLTLLGALLFTSKGGGGIAGAGIVKLAATVQSSPILPLSGLGLLIGVDRFMSEARSITNVIGNTVATFVVAKWEGAFDPVKFEACLAAIGSNAAKSEAGSGRLLSGPEDRPERNPGEAA